MSLSSEIIPAAISFFAFVCVFMQGPKLFKQFDGLCFQSVFSCRDRSFLNGWMR